MVHSYRDSIDVRNQAYISDREILEYAAGRDSVSPVEIAESRRRENVIRLQCRDLVREGLLHTRTHDVFSITDAGIEFLPGQADTMSEEGMLNLDNKDTSSPMAGDQSIRNFNILDAETIKAINLSEFEGEEMYGFVRNDRSLTRQRIQNVPARQLNRVIREFPTNDSLAQQCAHWMRAFSGLHFFPDANHRTGMNTLQILVGEGDHDAELPLAANIDWYVLQSKLIRHLQSDIRFNTLWKRDEHYSLWHDYFRKVLHNVSDPRRPRADSKHLRKVLNYARRRNEIGISS